MATTTVVVFMRQHHHHQRTLPTVKCNCFIHVAAAEISLSLPVQSPSITTSVTTTTTVVSVKCITSIADNCNCSVKCLLVLRLFQMEQQHNQSKHQQSILKLLLLLLLLHLQLQQLLLPSMANNYGLLNWRYYHQMLINHQYEEEQYNQSTTTSMVQLLILLLLNSNEITGNKNYNQKNILFIKLQLLNYSNAGVVVVVRQVDTASADVSKFNNNKLINLSSTSEASSSCSSSSNYHNDSIAISTSTSHLPEVTEYFSTALLLVVVKLLFLLFLKLFWNNNKFCDKLRPFFCDKMVAVTAISSTNSTTTSEKSRVQFRKRMKQLCDERMLSSRRRMRKRSKWMETMKILLMVVVVGIAVPNAEAGTHERRLLTDLLSNYQILERPVANESMSLQVRFGVTLQQVIDVDEKNQQIITNMWLKMEWEDANLVWNPEDYGGITNLRISPDRVWRPDILMYNSADEKFDGTFHTNVVVLSNGTLTYLPPGIFKSTCKIDITWFPFDDQYCDLKFGSWTYQLDALDLKLINEFGDISSYIPNGEWVLLNLPGERHEEEYECCPSKYIDITFRVGLRRRTLYYGFNLIVPSMIISSMTLLSFTLPPDSGEKLTLGVTILLSMIVFLMQLAEIMPATSDSVSIVGSYFACIMVMVAFSVVMTVVVLNFHHRTTEQQQEMPRWIRTVICTWLPLILFIKRPPDLFIRYTAQQKAEIEAAEAAQAKAPWDTRTHPLLPLPNLTRPPHHHHPGVSAYSAGGGHYRVPLYDPTGAPRPAEPSIAELMFLNDKIKEYEAMVAADNSSRTHRQGCPSVASNASLSRANTMVGNHVPFGGATVGGGVGGGGSRGPNGHFGCNGGGGGGSNDLRHRGGAVSKCPYEYTSYPPPPPHSHHFADVPEGDSGLGSSGNHGYLFTVLGSSEEPATFIRDEPTHAATGLIPTTSSTSPQAANACCCCCCSSSGAEQSSAFFLDVMQELRFITNRLRREDDLSDIIGEWKFAAIVIDRLCLIVFSTFAVLSTAVCLFSAPHLIA